MAKVGHFFKMLWARIWPAVKVMEPVAGPIFSSISPRIAKAIVAGEVAYAATRGVQDQTH